MFLKLKIDIPLESNLSKIATFFLHPLTKRKKLFLFLLKLLIVKMISLFIILSSLTMSSIWFEKDRALLKKTVIVFLDVLFLFIVENKSFCFRCSCSNNASLFTFIADFLNSPIK